MRGREDAGDAFALVPGERSIMTAHKLAAMLMQLPDVPVLINGWGSHEGLGPFEVSSAALEKGATFCTDYHGEDRCEDALWLDYGDPE